MRGPRRTALERFAILGAVIIAAIPSASAQSQDAPYRVTQSFAIGDTPTLHVTPASSPRIVATEGGYCAAWLDQREGGALVATRIDQNGDVVDPTGVLISPASVPPAAMFSSPGGCVVVFRSSPSLHGYLIPNDAERDPEPAFTIPGTVLPVRAFDNRLIVWNQEPGRQRLQSYEANGMLLHEIDLDQIEGNIVVLVTIKVDGRLLMITSGAHGPWRVYETGLAGTAELLSELDGRVDADPSNTWFAPLEGGLIMASRSESTLNWMTFDLAGALLARGTTAFTRPAEITDTSNLVLEFTRSRGGRMLTSDLREEEASVVFEDSTVGFTRRDDRWVFASAGWFGSDPPGIILEGESLDRQGTVLNHAPRRQVLLDTAVENERAALVWSEEGDDIRTYLGIFDGHEMKLEHTLPISTVEHQFWTYGSAAVAINDGIVLVVWREFVAELNQFEFFYRRAAFNGRWLENSRHLVTAPGLSFTERGLIKDRNGFLVVFSETNGADPFPETIVAKAVRIDRYGSATVFDLTPAALALPRVVVPVPDGYAVLDVGPNLCRITCPPGPAIGKLTIALLDHDLRYVTTAPGLRRYEIVEEIIGAASHGDTVVLAAGTQSYVMRRLGPFLWSAPEPWFSGGDEAVWLDDRYVVIGRSTPRFGPDAGGPSMLTIAEVRPGSQRRTGPMEPFIEDWTASEGFPSFFQCLRPFGDRLILFSNLVSRDPQNGYVRRLHAHELVLEDDVGRPRGVRRAELEN